MRVAISLVVLLVSSVSLYTYAQSGEKVREIPGDFVAEDGCPVSVNTVRTAFRRIRMPALHSQSAATRTPLTAAAMQTVESELAQATARCARLAARQHHTAL